MKTLLIIACLVLTGCGSLHGILERAIPDGKWDKLDLTVNGKFSATKIDASDVSKSGKSITAGDLHVRHSNLWVALVEFHGTGYKSPQPGPAEK